MTAIVDRKPGPGRVFYLLALVPLVIGFAAMAVILVMSLPKLDDGLKQIVVPGERVLALEPGVHTVFLETHSVVDGRTYVVDNVAGLSVNVVGADGAPVAVTTPTASSTYALGGRAGYAINTFEIERAGDYSVSARYPDGDGPTTVIAVGQGFLSLLLVTVFSALAAALTGGLLAIGVVIWVAVLRRRARRPIP